MCREIRADYCDNHKESLGIAGLFSQCSWFKFMVRKWVHMACHMSQHHAKSWVQETDAPVSPISETTRLGYTTLSVRSQCCLHWHDRTSRAHFIACNLYVYATN
jgi:hypothetical protein